MASNFNWLINWIFHTKLQRKILIFIQVRNKFFSFPKMRFVQQQLWHVSKNSKKSYSCHACWSFSYMPIITSNTAVHRYELEKLQRSEYPILDNWGMLIPNITVIFPSHLWFSRKLKLKSRKWLFWRFEQDNPEAFRDSNLWKHQSSESNNNIQNVSMSKILQSPRNVYSGLCNLQKNHNFEHCVIV